MFCYRKGIIDLDAKVPNGAFDFGVAEQELNRPQVARAPIDQGRLGSPERMGPEEVRVQPNARDPLGDEPRILPGRHAQSRTPAGEQKFTRPSARNSQIVVDCLTSLFRQFELDWPPRFLLPHRRPIDRVPVRCNIIDFDSDDVATTELAVDRQVE